MKGMELPIGFLILLIIGVIVFAVVAVLLFMWYQRGGGNISLTQQHTNLCSYYSEFECKISDASFRYPTLQSDITAVCQELAYISSMNPCSNFDEDCGRPCCRAFCP